MRAVLVQLHRYLGLTLAGLLFLIGTTGAVLAFQRELDAALNPGLYRAASQAPALPLDILKARVERQLPGAAIVAIQPPWAQGETALLKVEPGSSEASLDYDEVFVDPGSGKVAGTRLRGACCLAPVNLVPFLFKLHYTLHLPGLWGVWLTGGVAALWTIDCVVALALSAPRGGRRLDGWRRALSIKPRASGPRRVVDLHRAPGLWLWIVLLMTAVTGVGLNLRDQVFEPVVSFFSPVTPPLFEQPTPDKPSPDRLTFDQAAVWAQDLARAGGRPGTVAYVLRSEELHAYGVAITRREHGDPRGGLGPDWYYLDTRDGALRSSDLAGRGTKGDVVMQARYPLHTGLAFGRAGQLLICFAGLATASLSVTGVLIWSIRRRAKVRRADHVAL